MPGETQNEPDKKRTDPAHSYAAEPLPAGHSHPEERAAGGGERDHVGIIPRGPRSMLVYWELAGEKSSRIRRAADRSPQWLLRAEETTSGQCREMAINPDAGNFYLDVKPGTRYVVELGGVLDGEFHPVCSSQARRTPPERPAHHSESLPGGGGERAAKRADLHDKGGHDRGRDTESQSPDKTVPGLRWEPGIFGPGSPGGTEGGGR